MSPLNCERLLIRTRDTSKQSPFQTGDSPRGAGAPASAVNTAGRGSSGRSSRPRLPFRLRAPPSEDRAEIALKAKEEEDVKDGPPHKMLRY